MVQMMRIFIRIKDQPYMELELKTGQVYTVGRSPNSQVLLPFPQISRHLCRFAQREDGQWWVEPDKPNGWKAEPILSQGSISLPGDVEVLAEAALNTELTWSAPSPDAIALPVPETQKKESSLRARFAFAAGFTLVGALLAGAGVLALKWYQQVNGPMDPTRLAAYAKERIVTIEHRADEDWLKATAEKLAIAPNQIAESRGFCTGFLTAPDVMITAYHCLFGISGLEASSRHAVRDHTGRLLKISRVLGVDLARDTLVIELEHEAAAPRAAFELAESWTPGQRAFTVGNAEGEGVILRDGLLTGETASEYLHDVRYLRYSAAASPGNSGGPLIDERGRLLGLVIMRSQSENYNKAVRVEDLKQSLLSFAESREPKSVSFDIRRWPTWVARERARSLLAVFQMPLPDVEIPTEMSPFEELAIDLDMPATLENFGDQVFRRLDARLQERRAALVSDLSKQKKGIFAWEHLLTDESPVVSPYGDDKVLRTVARVKSEAGSSYSWSQPGDVSLGRVGDFKQMGVPASFAVDALEPIRFELPEVLHGARVHSNQQEWSAFRAPPGSSQLERQSRASQVRFAIEWAAEGGEQDSVIESVYRALIRSADGRVQISTAEIIPFLRDSAPKTASLNPDVLVFKRLMEWPRESSEESSTVLYQAVRFERTAVYVYCVSRKRWTHCSEELQGDAREMPGSMEVTSRNHRARMAEQRLFAGHVERPDQATIYSLAQSEFHFSELGARVKWPQSDRIVAVQALPVLLREAGSDEPPRWVDAGVNFLAERGVSRRLELCSIAMSFGDSHWYPSLQEASAARNQLADQSISLPLSQTKRRPSSKAAEGVAVVTDGPEVVKGHRTSWTGACTPFEPKAGAPEGVLSLDSASREALTFRSASGSVSP
jgi:S1-C subfamily serine protease